MQMPVIGGQREVILGPKPIELAMFRGFLEREIAPSKLATPDNTGGYVDSWMPGGTHEESLGAFECSTREDRIFNQDCSVITSTATWYQKIGSRKNPTNEVNWENTAKEQIWVTPDGKILRHYLSFTTPRGTQTGDCVYSADSIERRFTDEHNKTSFGELFPSCGMEALNARFKPMIVDGKVVLREKEYFVANPLSGAIDKYTARIGGKFKGEYLHATFRGTLVDIEGPNRSKQQIYLDDTGDLIKLTLDSERYFVISSVPKTHRDESGVPIRRSGGGGSL
jgi:hypothetical protein